jgi:putative methionine-R-sulfoxide reductase with GAF domain
MNHQTPRARRNYDGAKADLRARLSDASSTGVPPVTNARMQLLVDVLWDHFGGEGDGRCVSWVGFYLPVYDAAGEPTEMVLGPRRDRPASSPIGLHGACGCAFLTGAALVVADVTRLGENYVACDPRDRAELVIPCVDETGRAYAVLDFDSYEANAFSTDDVAPVAELLRVAGLHEGAALEITLI